MATTPNNFKFPPPPTYAEPTIVEPTSGKAVFNPIWLKWFLDIAQILSNIGQTFGGITHNNLGGLQGGSPGQYYHLPVDNYSAVLAGTPNSVTITTAKLTPAGSNGSMTFLRGILLNQTPAT